MFQNIYWKTIYHDIPIPQTYHRTLNDQQKYTKAYPENIFGGIKYIDP